MFFEKFIKQEVKDPVSLDNDIKKLYISKFIVTELRKYYTERERNLLQSQKKGNKLPIVEEC